MRRPKHKRGEQQLWSLAVSLDVAKPIMAVVRQAGLCCWYNSNRQRLEGKTEQYKQAMQALDAAGMVERRAPV